MAAVEGFSEDKNLPVPDPTRLTTAQLHRELESLRELMESRFDAMDEATRLRLNALMEMPVQTDRQIGHLKGLHDERFKSIETQFAERDIRTTQASEAAKQALDAALLAAKELVAQQNRANAAAADKVEASTTKQIDQIGLRIEALQKGFDARLTELKERIDRGEGSHTGAADTRTEHRLDTGQILQALILGVAALSVLAGILVAVFHK